MLPLVVSSFGAAVIGFWGNSPTGTIAAADQQQDADSDLAGPVSDFLPQG
jgi:hypothetical protein